MPTDLHPAADPAGSGLQSARTRRVLTSSFVGTTIEWYDFYLYGTAAALVFSHQFFPETSAVAGVLASFATFAVGFLARPVGGLVAGHLGDHLGRKSLLVYSLVLMGVATTLIGVLPGYATAGWFAVAALVALRLLQGLATGAEWGGSALLSAEHAPAGRRGFFASFTQVGSAAGMLLATAAFGVVQVLTTDAQFDSWGWRIPFLASAGIVVLGLWIRLGVQDAEEFQQVQAQGRVERAPLRVLLRDHRRALLVTVGLRLVQNAIYFIFTVYAIGFVADVRGDRESVVTAILVVSGLGLASGPLWGWLSDRFGRRAPTLVGTVGSGVFVWIFFAYLNAGPLWLLPLVMAVGMNVVHDSMYGPQAAWFAEQFPVEVRYSGVSFGYQVGTVFAGGLSPLIAAWLYEVGGHRPWLICGYLTVLAALSTWAALAARGAAPYRSSTSTADRDEDDRQLVTTNW